MFSSDPETANRGYLLSFKDRMDPVLCQSCRFGGWLVECKAKLFKVYIAPFVQVDAAGLIFPEATLDITGGNNLQVKAKIHQPVLKCSGKRASEGGGGGGYYHPVFRFQVRWTLKAININIRLPNRQVNS